MPPIYGDIHGKYPMVICYIAIEKWPSRNSSNLHSKNGDFPVSFLYVYQRLIVLPTLGPLLDHLVWNDALDSE